MSLPEKFESIFGRFSIPNFLPVWLGGQFLAFAGVYTGLILPEQLLLNGYAVWSGEWWRVISFLLMPGSLNPLWAMVSLLVAGFMGGALISRWGETRFNLFVGTAWFLTVAASLLLDRLVMTNQYILWLLTLAFAHLFPETEFRLYFLVPVKVKYLGYILWGYFALFLVTGSLDQQLMILSAVLSWLLFFGGDLVSALRNKQRRERFRRDVHPSSDTPMHTCSICGKTSQSHPETDFRYQRETCACAAYFVKGSCDT